MLRFAAFLLLIAGLVPRVSADVVVGLPPDAADGNCVPFGCGDLLSGGGITGTRYQQVYSATDFSGTIDITGLTFFLTQFIPTDPSSGFLNGGTYTVSLSTTSQPVNGLNLADFDANVGADDTVIFSGALPAFVAFGGSFTLGGTGDFSYNPAQGNLLMDIQIVGLSAPTTGETFLDARNGTAGGVFSRADNLATGFDDTGLVTEFDTTTTSSVPEPSSIVLLIVALGSWAAVRRVKSLSVPGIRPAVPSRSDGA